MDPHLYSFGTRLARRADFYGYPRTGSHFLFTCLTGLFDLVFFPTRYANDPEAMQRAEELNPHTFYMMKLREDGVPQQPVYINPEPNGTHGTPQPGDWPAIILIRDPHPSIYSYYHTARDRWNLQVEDRREWIQSEYQRYSAFYDKAFAMKYEDPEMVHLIRFEDLKRDPAALERLVQFIGVRPKLTPAFVHWATQFDRMTRQGHRTFFRGGDNRRWQEDTDWAKDLAAISIGDMRRFGYPKES